MNPAKKVISDLVEIFDRKGLKNIVISPGSRNAPIADEFIRNGNFNCYSIVDERSAGFFALGMAQQLQEPVALLCTSGTAVLNFAPAVAEAFYQKVPLVVLTADRPREWVNQGESQTIDQRNIYQNYSKAAYDLPQNSQGDGELLFSARLLSEAINTAGRYPQGPVQVNISLDEPLYETKEAEHSNPKTISIHPTEDRIAAHHIDELKTILNNAPGIMVLTGVLHRDKRLNQLLNSFAAASSVAVLTETTSNLSGERFFPCIDRLLAAIEKNELEQFKPEVLITFGDQVISKRIKAFLRKHRPPHHWHIDPARFHFDTYQSLTKSIPVTPTTFFEQLGTVKTATNSNYHEQWKTKDLLAEERHKEFIEKTTFSDLTVFQSLLEQLPESSVLQMGNSSPVRYVQLFRNRDSLSYFSNRGTSGIEGCTSTAAGAAMVTKNFTTLITGDLGFFYDANGLWNRYLSPKLRIIVINNAGGGIFRFIEGPETVAEFETFIETNHDLKAELLAKLHGLDYFYAENELTLKEQLNRFFDENSKKAAILEVKTPRLKNAEILRKYFEYINKGV